MKRYKAYYIPKGSTVRAALTAVLARNKEHAHQRITEELEKPGRQLYLHWWEDSGKLIECMEEQEAKSS